jgi:hypothetical protein
MSQPGSTPPSRVPTLTEVVAWPEPGAGASPSAPAGSTGPLEANVMKAPPSPANPLPQPSRLTEDQLVQRVLEEVQRQVDMVLEYRVREALTPALARVADSIVREARGELASTLRDVVARAVAQELARHRTR